MRPHRQKHLSKTKASLRARARLREGFAWLRGHPVGVPTTTAIDWFSIPEPGIGLLPERISVDRERLRRTTFRKNRLRRDFPRVLPDLVGEVSRWSDDIDMLLAPLKAWIHHGTALPSRADLIGDPTRARARARALTEQATEASRRYPTLTAVIDALFWCARDARQLGRHLTTVDTHGAALVQIAAFADEVATVAMCIELLTADGPRATVLLTMFAEPDTDLILDDTQACELRRSSSVFEQRFRTCAAGPPPWPALRQRDGSLRRSLLPLLRSVYVHKAPLRRRMLDLLSIVWPRDLGRQWARCVARYTKTCEWADTWTQVNLRSTDFDADRSQFSRIHRQLERLAQRLPPRRPSSTLEALLAWLEVTRETPGLATSARKTLRALPEYHGDAAARLKMVSLWYQLATTDEQPMSWLADLVRKTGSYLRPPNRHTKLPPHALLPWAVAFGDGGSIWDCLPFETLDEQPRIPPQELWRGLAALRDTTEFPVCAASLRLLDPLLIATGSSALAIKALHAIHAADRVQLFAKLQPCTVRMLCKFTPSDPQRLLELAQAIGEGGDDGGDDGEGEGEGEEAFEWDDLEALELLPALDRQGFFGAALLGGERHRVIAVARQVQTIRGFHGRHKELTALPWPRTAHRPDRPDRPSRPNRPSWRRYPKELRGALADLAAATDDAEQIAAEILRRDFPDPQTLRSEIRGLESRLADAQPARAAGMRKRLAARRQVLDSLRHGPNISSRRLTNYATKIRKRATRIVLDHLGASLRQTIVRRLAGKLPQECLTWCGQHQLAQTILPYLTALPPKILAVALRLMVARTGEPPWDLREAEPNRAFQRRMTRLGISMAPFLERRTESVTAKNGRTIHLALETDPLEVFLMGERFNTCLSLGRENFYSTIGNAADLNKRVLYARDTSDARDTSGASDSSGDRSARGKVIGRCLLAITRTGQLLRFYAYCHQPEVDFDAIVDSYCQRLAKEMSTAVGSGGAVETLVSPAWYDDGACDIVGREPWLQDGSTFLGSLATTGPRDFVATIDARTANQPDATTLLRILLALQQADRADLVAAMRGWILAATDIRLLTKAAHLASIAGQRNLADEILHRLPRTRRPFAALDFATLEEIVTSFVDLSPHRALQILRWTRDASVRRWADEWNYRRVFAAAKSHENLHRRRAALGLYRQAAKLVPDDEACTARIRVIEKVLGR